MVYKEEDKRFRLLKKEEEEEKENCSVKGSVS
jgi:hypothetical protein